MIWVYKCNSKDHPDQVRFGDWNYVFKANRALSWGSTKWARELKDAQKGDTILAYQTDRNINGAKADMANRKWLMTTEKRNGEDADEKQSQTGRFRNAGGCRCTCLHGNGGKHAVRIRNVL